MRRNGVILLLILICVAFLVSCGKRESADTEKGELVRIEAGGNFPSASLHRTSLGDVFAQDFRRRC